MKNIKLNPHNYEYRIKVITDDVNNFTTFRPQYKLKFWNRIKYDFLRLLIISIISFLISLFSTILGSIALSLLIFDYLIKKHRFKNLERTTSMESATETIERFKSELNDKYVRYKLEENRKNNLKVEVIKL